MSWHQLKKRFVRQRMQREALARRETRDAILWDIQADNTCRVKVLGSNDLLVCKFPQNWGSKPTWLRPGTAVKVLCTGGNRYQLEVVGYGMAIPTPTGGPMGPTPGAGPDAVLEGLNLYPFEIPEMKVWVETGSFRIGGVEYEVEPMTLAESNVNTLGSGAPLESCAGAVTIGASHASLYRIDIVVIGTDKVLDVVTGTAAASPVEPGVPANHLRLGSVLVPPGVTVIGGENINRTFVEQQVSQVVVYSVSDSDLAWGENTSTITVHVRDQYGRAVTGTSWGILAEVASGTGYIDDNASAASATKYTGTGSNVATFTYTRSTGTEVSPMLKFSLIQNPSLYSMTSIILRDSGGEVLL